MKYRSVASVAVAIFVALPSAVVIPTDGWAQIEEIVVTTRRREENLQEVPIAVTAINVQTIRRQNINNMFDVTQLGFSSGFGAGMTHGTLPDPRVWGIRANYRFEN